MDLITGTISRVLSAPVNALDAIVKPMDTVFNIPLISVLLLPSLSSWSTSFNVLFFYATWSLLLMTHSPLAVEFLGTLLIRLVFFVVPSLLFLGLDTLLPFVMRNIKQHGDDGIATSAENGGFGGRGRWWRVTLLSLFNLFLGVALQTAVDWTLTSVLHTRSALVVSTTLPMPWSIIKNLVAGYLLREVISYLAHRYVLHGGSSGIVGRYAAAYHRHFYHYLHTPLPMSAHFDHPLPYLIRIWLPAYLPAALLRFHLLTYHLWLALISIEEALVYSNYSTLPTGLILGGMARRAERHLRSDGDGNFSVYGLADLLMGTSVGDLDDVLEEAVEEARRRDLPNKAKRKGRQIKDKADEVQTGARRELRQRRTRSGRSQS